MQVLGQRSHRDVVDARRRDAPYRVEIEVETLDEFRDALAARPDVILLDEFDEAALREAVALNRAAGAVVKIEASGGVDLDTVRRIAATGVDYISVGSLTKHLHATDLSLRFTLS